MEDSVLVIVGKWKCGDFGRWRFDVSEDEMARFVGMSEDTSYESFVSNLAKAFNLEDDKSKLGLSFLYETETTAFTQGKMPPVSISCDVGLRQFKRTRMVKKDLNLLLTLKSVVNEVLVGVDIEEPDNTPSDDILVAHMERVESEYMGTKRIDLVDKIGCNKMAFTEFGGQSSGMEVDVQSEEEEYDCDGWTELINKDYPPDWDPFEEANLQRRKRKKASEASSGTKVRRQEKTQDVGNNGGQPSGVCVEGDVGNPTMDLVDVNAAIEVSEPASTPQKTQVGLFPRLSPMGFSLGLESNTEDITDVIDDRQQLVVYSVDNRGGNVMDIESVDEGRNLSTTSMFRTTPFSDDDDVFVEDSFIYFDAPPVRDNMKGLPSDKSNMDLRKAEDAIYVGKVLKDKNELRKTLSIYAMKRLFHFKMGKSDRKRAIAICADDRCDWRVYAKTQQNSKNVEIRKLCLKHTCDVGTRSKYGKNATSQILADIMKAKFANGKKGPRACEIPTLVLEECNVTISYMKAWHAKEMAISRARGNEEGSYQFLSTYFHLLKTSNPGTITKIHTTLNKEGATQFKYLFFALGGSIAGYKYLRKVVVIDGTQMSGKYKGCLVAASGQDGNAQIFPLGFGVIDGENEAGWEWFFRQLKAFIPDEDDLVFVSDRHAGIYAGLGKVYPRAYHGACVVHLIRNVKHRYKCDGLAKIVDHAARSYTLGGFRYWFAEIKLRRPACAQYLEDIGFEHWSLANFKGLRYNVMSSNISESLNAAMKKAVDYPIAIMVEFIRGMLMTWFCTRRKVASRTRSRCTPEVEDQLIAHLRDSTDCEVISASAWIFQVNDGAGCVFKVDLEKRTCSCRVFDVLLIPCCHAIAAVAVNGVDIHSLVSECYSVKEWGRLYEQVILPVPKEMDSDVPAAIKSNDVKPPKTKRGAGRPKKKRIPSQGEQMGGKKIHKCSRCSGRGHNKATCKNPI